MLVKNKDTHTLCPVPGSAPGLLPLQEGTRVRYQGRTLTVKGSTPYMAWFQEKGGLHVPGASKATPVEIEIEIEIVEE